jgi:hypothetical protein
LVSKFRNFHKKCPEALLALLQLFAGLMGWKFKRLNFYLTFGSITISSEILMFHVYYVWYFPRGNKFSEYKSFPFSMFSLAPNTNAFRGYSVLISSKEKVYTMASGDFHKPATNGFLSQIFFIFALNFIMTLISTACI